ncbi:PKD domain-containing protein [Methanosarcina mazei]|uniref:PKD domain-containing protein n=1 Tax=Methanosarcina mazei TaxID=2209 RepID=A0A0F8G6U2_METMZ|nr:PKD domain-containing protein [Methanosarcina mazei]KKG27651.1 hypothetical protein DU52_01945 [Methanosarcina mazei]KKG31868.1 hypothetical protein DU30_17140 [Methanosarcina mazei]KKG50720.1 hypothetical protein DU33_19825 [Methanosarcina mazei]KKG60176.1 hypothetical protein DU64_00305 [Methanosarcina mazei]KKG65415.1 hypothetical protein DU45_19255 [Methanosarcina mazei]
MSKIIPKKVNKRDRLDLIISTLTAPLLFIIIFSSIVLIAVAQIDGVEEYTTDTEYAPDAEFSADVIWGYAPLTVKFTDESTGNPTEWKWNFGDGSPIIDGTTSDYQNPTYTYEKAGVYEVKETAINSAGRNTEIKSHYITVVSPYDPDPQSPEYAPDAEFSADVTSGYVPLTVKFTDESTGNPTEWKWNFGDGSDIIDGTTSDYQNPTHTYKKAGIYEVKETAINSAGRNTEIKTGYITVKSLEQISEKEPDAEFSADVTSGYAPLTVKFTDKSPGNPTEWKWNFGDGSPIIDGFTLTYQNPTHTYEKAGVYEVKETAINSAGRNTEIKTGYITVKPSDDSDLQPSKHTPNAEFFADITSGYAPLAVKFTDESTGHPTEWKWNFGDGSPIIDGTTSDYQNPTHTYEKAGVYEVKETAINSVGRNTEIKTEYITVKSSKDIENTDYSGSQISDEKYFTRDSQDESDTETDVPPQTQIIETITQFYTTHVEDISTTFIDDKDTNTIYNNPSSDPSNGDSIVNNIITVIGSIISAVIVAYIQTKRK